MVTNNRIPEVRGDVLKKAREAKGISVSELATKVCFSIKQIEQLENGEKSHFYSLAIKANAAKRVADELGLSHDEVFDFGPDLVQEAKVSESRTGENASDGEIKNSAQEPSLDSETKSKPEWLERFDEPLEPKPKKNRSLYYFGSAAIVIALGVVAFNMNQPQSPKLTEIAKLPSESVNNPSDLKKEDSTSTNPSLNSNTQLPAAPVTSAIAAAPSQSADGCPTLDPNTVSYRSPIASKPGNMLYVQSRSAQTVCVKDASGKLEKKSLEAGGVAFLLWKSPLCSDDPQLRPNRFILSGL